MLNMKAMIFLVVVFLGIIGGWLVLESKPAYSNGFDEEKEATVNQRIATGHRYTAADF